MLETAASDIRADAAASLEQALTCADVIFTHDPFSAESALAR